LKFSIKLILKGELIKAAILSSPTFKLIFVKHNFFGLLIFKFTLPLLAGT